MEKQNKREKQNLIQVEPKTPKSIAKIFRCSESMVSQSLSGKKRSKLSQKIRHVALTQYNGVELVPITKQAQTIKPI